jgi:PAS domain S-box-containing protein
MQYSKQAAPAPPVQKKETVPNASSVSSLPADSISRFESEGGILTSVSASQNAEDDAHAGLRAALQRVHELEHQLGATRISFELAQIDATALKESEAALRRSEDNTKAILDEVPPLLILDHDLRVVMANKSFYSHFRVAPPQTENCKIYDLGNGQWDIPRLRVLLEEVLPRNSFFNDFEITHTFPSLGVRTILLSGRRVNHLEKILLNIEDVTERLHFQTGMRRSELRYRRLFEAAKDGIIIVDPGTQRISDCNPYILELLEYTRTDMLGKELWQIGLLKDEQASQEAFRELQKSGYIRYEDLPFETKSGARREVEFVSNLYHENGSKVIQCNIRDISARKRTERALAAANDEISRHAAQLEENVADRTARLRETIGELEMFSYSVAHDMRAPLRAMEGFAQMLIEDYGTSLPPEAKDHVAYITSAAARMDLLIQDVLTYTTILHSEMKTSVVDLDVLVRQVIQTYPPLHATGTVIQIEGLLPKVLGHPAAISQCISNILTNAVKFVAPGTKPNVKIRATENHSYLRLWVEDNGIGIDPKDHKRIFGMFERVSNEYEGTGIGLAIVRKSIERLRGNVGLESAMGEGSKFWVEFRKIK